MLFDNMSDLPLKHHVVDDGYYSFVVVCFAIQFKFYQIVSIVIYCNSFQSFNQIIEANQLHRVLVILGVYRNSNIFIIELHIPQDSVQFLYMCRNRNMVPPP
eukprot:Lankesteria_metandrocarpae@DN548_c0_g1_i1.p1